MQRFLLSIFLPWLPVAYAHEISPAIVELSFDQNRVELVAELNLEAILAGIDMSQASSTEGAANEDKYDELRRLSSDELGDIFQNSWDDLSQKFYVLGRGDQISLSIVDLDIPQVGDPELPRNSRVVLSGGLPAQVNDVMFGWSADLGVMVLRVSENGVTSFADYVDPGEMSPVIEISNWKPLTRLQAFFTFIPVGFDHILPKGLDHILFVVGLFLLSTNLRVLLWQVSTFTAAHTVTLAIGSLGLVTVSPSIVEPLIALSIAYVAIENILSSKLVPSRIGLIFVFGLLHGLGFASVLAEFGLPENGVIPALIGFNIGVEFGQLAVVLICFLAFGYWFNQKPWYRKVISIPLSVAIASVGLWWAFERVFFA
jgi:hydrogenase/urease accessory protein HupE